MATIDDFGGTSDPLNAPPLGGPTGWAAAVRDYIKNLPGDIADKVSKAGDTMTGNLTIEAASPLLVANQPAPGAAAGVLSRVDGVNRWVFGTNGSSVSNFSISAYDDTGTLTGDGLWIERSTRLARVAGDPNHAMGIATKQYVDNGTTGNVTPATGWTDYGASYAGLLVTSSGPLVAMEGLLKRTSDLTVVAGSIYTVATVPTGFRPSHDLIVPAVFAFSGGTNITSGRLAITTAGSVTFSTATAGTLTTAGWLAIAGTWRAA